MINITMAYSANADFSAPTTLVFDTLDVLPSAPRLNRVTDVAIDGTPLEHLVGSFQTWDVVVDANRTATSQAFLDAFYTAKYRRLTFSGTTYDVIPDPKSTGDGLEKKYVTDGSFLPYYIFHLIWRQVAAL